MVTDRPIVKSWPILSSSIERVLDKLDNAMCKQCTINNVSIVRAYTTADSAVSYLNQARIA